MTTHAPRSIPSVPAPVPAGADALSPPLRRLTAMAAAAGPALMVASTVAYVANGAGISEGEAGGAIQVWAFIVYGIALVGLARTVERIAPRAAAAVTALGVAGAGGGVAYGIDAIQLAVLDGTIHDSPATPVALRIPGMLFPLALAVLGVVLARTDGGRPRWIGWALVAGAVLFPVGRIADLAPVALASDLVLAAVIVTLALPLLRPTPANF